VRVIVTARSHSASMKSSTKVALIGLVITGLAAIGAFVGFSLKSNSNVGPSAPPRGLSTSAPALHTTLIAALGKTTSAYLSPGGHATIPIAASWHGSPLDLPVIALRDGYLEVRLPSRPNGSTTWIRRNSVHLLETQYKIVIDLSTRHLLLYRDGKLTLDAPAGIGTVADPTPTGHFFVAFFAKAPSAAWGPFVMVTSAHSNAISDWEESGDAIVAIHGPLGADQAIGTTGAQVSHGCVRLHDVALVQLRAVPDGSPVEIIS